MMNKTIFITIVICLLGIHSNSHALPTLRISSGTLPAEVTDNGLGDLNGDLGIIHTQAEISVWVIDVTATVVNQTLDLIVAAYVKDPFVVARPDLTISFSQTGFTGPGLGDFLFIGDKVGGKVTAEAFYDKDDILFGTGKAIGSALIFDQNKWIGRTFGAVESSNYSLTIQTVISANNGQSDTTFEAKLAVPEPGTILLLGLGLVAVAAVIRMWQRP